jgi:hypothetical protein
MFHDEKARPYYLRTKHVTSAHDFKLHENEGGPKALITAVFDGQRLPVAEVDTQGDSFMGKIILALLKRYRGQLDWHTATGSKSRSSAQGALDNAGDEYGMWGHWLAVAEEADRAAAEWTAHADRLAAIATTTPRLIELPRFNPHNPDYNNDYAESPPPLMSNKFEVEDRKAKLAGHARSAAGNAYAYRAYADQLRAYVKAEWPHVDASPLTARERGETDEQE